MNFIERIQEVISYIENKLTKKQELYGKHRKESSFEMRKESFDVSELLDDPSLGNKIQINEDNDN